MAKAKSVAKKSAPAARKSAPKPTAKAPKAKPAAPKKGLLESAKSAASRLMKAATGTEKKSAKAPAAAKKIPATKPAAKAAAPKEKAPAKAAAAKAPAKAPAAKTPVKAPAVKAPAVKAVAAKVTAPLKAALKGEKAEKPEKALSKAAQARADRPRPRASKLPPPMDPLTKREMEQILTIGQGRGVGGEGSIKGRLVVREEFPYLLVIGRDKRELSFLLQGPDQEVFPAYADHKVSVTGLIRKTSNNGGTVDVRKYSAKKPETESDAQETGPAEEKLRFLSPGEVAMFGNPGMGAGMKGFATIRGNVEMTGDTFVLVVSNGGTRQQVSFTLEGKGIKSLRKNLGQTVQVTGVVDKTSGWGGTVQVEAFEPRAAEYRSVTRENLEVTEIAVGERDTEGAAEARLNNGLVVRLNERVGYTWAIEPTAAKRVGLREANFEPAASGPGTREFFFTPRNPGTFEVEFFLAKAFTPAQVAKTYKLVVTVKP